MTEPELLCSGEEERLLEEEEEEEEEDVSVGGYSPPAWRRLGNGDRSPGFWGGPSLDKPRPGLFRDGSPVLNRHVIKLEGQKNEDMFHEGAKGHANGLETASRIGLPRGSSSSGKVTDPSTERQDKDGVPGVDNSRPQTDLESDGIPQDNCKCGPSLAPPRAPR